MRSPRVIALIMIVGVISTACGARLPANVRSQAANALLNGGSSSGVSPGIQSTGQPGTSVNPGSSIAPSTGSQTIGGTKGTKGTKGSKGSQGGTGPGTTQTSGTKCPTGGTDVGLTKTTLNLGTIADVTGPVPGLFTGAEEGVEAFQDYINNTGGLCGHAVHFDFADGQTNCQANESDVNSLVKKDFALVGSFSLYDGCGATVLKNYPTVPDVHVALDPTAETLPNHFDLEPGALGYATGPWKFYANKLGSSVITHAGTIGENIPSAVDKQNAEVKAAESQGWKFVYSDNASPTTGDFAQNFQKMCGQDHIKVFFTTSEDAQNAATMISDENGVSACKGIVNIIPIAYDQSFLTFCQQVNCGANENSVQGWNEYALFFNKAEAANIPELQLFQTWFERANPGKPENLYGLFAWADARLFQQAFENAGTTATRKTVLAALHKIHSFNDNGVMATVDPGSKSNGATCYIAWRLSNGAFSRQDDPASSFRCDGTYLKY